MSFYFLLPDSMKATCRIISFRDRHLRFLHSQTIMMGHYVFLLLSPTKLYFLSESHLTALPFKALESAPPLSYKIRKFECFSISPQPISLLPSYNACVAMVPVTYRSLLLYKQNSSLKIEYFPYPSNKSLSFRNRKKNVSGKY